ncbi:uncharacterized protein LOC143694626 [Agelaius phoeniceus]|uniref:uncharacterized protein LOC143694626 n=1 Tax=Agelaius phoeniceus TaxID=39638 RepID=UPI004054F8CE
MAASKLGAPREVPVQGHQRLCCQPWHTVAVKSTEAQEMSSGDLGSNISQSCSRGNKMLSCQLLNGLSETRARTSPSFSSLLHSHGAACGAALTSHLCGEARRSIIC